MILRKLIRMANEIARNLRAQSGDQAGVATAEHIRSFWTPGMRARLIAHAASDDSELDAIALAACQILAQAKPLSTSNSATE